MRLLQNIRLFMGALILSIAPIFESCATNLKSLDGVDLAKPEHDQLFAGLYNSSPMADAQILGDFRFYLHELEASSLSTSITRKPIAIFLRDNQFVSKVKAVFLAKVKQDKANSKNKNDFKSVVWKLTLEELERLEKLEQSGKQVWTNTRDPIYELTESVKRLFYKRDVRKYPVDGQVTDDMFNTIAELTKNILPERRNHNKIITEHLLERLIAESSRQISQVRGGVQPQIIMFSQNDTIEVFGAAIRRLEKVKEYLRNNVLSDIAITRLKSMSEREDKILTFEWLKN